MITCREVGTQVVTHSKHHTLAKMEQRLETSRSYQSPILDSQNGPIEWNAKNFKVSVSWVASQIALSRNHHTLAATPKIANIEFTSETISYEKPSAALP